MNRSHCILSLILTFLFFCSSVFSICSYAEEIPLEAVEAPAVAGTSEERQATMEAVSEVPPIPAAVEAPSVAPQTPTITSEAPATTSEGPAVQTPAAASEGPAVQTPVAASEASTVQTPAAVSEGPAVQTPAATSGAPAVQTPAAASEASAVQTPVAASEGPAAASEPRMASEAPAAASEPRMASEAPASSEAPVDNGIPSAPAENNSSSSTASHSTDISSTPPSTHAASASTPIDTTPTLSSTDTSSSTSENSPSPSSPSESSSPVTSGKAVAATADQSALSPLKPASSESPVPDPAASQQATEPAASGSTADDPAAAGSLLAEPAASGSAATESAEAESILAESAASESPADEPAASRHTVTFSDLMRIAEEAGRTFSLLLKNQVYGYAGNSNDEKLSATFELSFFSDSLTAAPEGWTEPDGAAGSGIYLSNFSLGNRKQTTRGGIPSACSVNLTAEPNNALATDSAQTFTTSYIVDGRYQPSLPSILNEDGNAPAHSEFSLMRFANQGSGRKSLYVINDSKDPLTLSIDAQNYPCLFLYPTGSGKDSETILRGIPKVITLQPGEYGYLSLGAGDGVPSDKQLPDAHPLLTPLDVNVLAGISSVGAFDSANVWSLASGSSLEDGAYALFRVERRRTDTEDPRTGNSVDPDPGEVPGGGNEQTPDTPTQPEVPDTPEQPGTPDTPAQPGTPDPAASSETSGTPAPDAESTKQPEAAAPSDGMQLHTKTTGSPALSTKKHHKTAKADATHETAPATRRSLPAQPSEARTEPVNTADNTPIGRYLVLMLTAGAAALSLTLAKRRK